MENTLMLLLLSAVMLIGSYFAGIIPLVMNMSEEKLQLVSVLGAGLLVGTALAVIIPEGMQTLYSARAEAKPTSSTGHSDHETDLFAVVGVSLVLGFVFMLLVDQCSRSRGRDLESGKQEKSMTATVGLVVHAAADGVALGAAATTPHQDVEMIVFVAIMLHKAPAAFGLVTFLLHEGMERNRIRRHLGVFSIAAPLLAIITYFGISQEGKETLSTVNATGIAMLFSAGTFLYVATVHVLPEVTTRSGHSHGLVPSAPSAVPVELGEPKGFRRIELLALVCGALLPLLLTLGHHH